MITEHWGFPLLFIRWLVWILCLGA